MASPDCSVGWITVPSEEVANKIAESLLENKLIACVNIIPGVTSRYWWNGKIESDTELLLMIKTRSNLSEKIIANVKANHPYDTPEVIFASITDGNPQYLQWILNSTSEVETNPL